LFESIEKNISIVAAQFGAGGRLTMLFTNMEAADKKKLQNF